MTDREFKAERKRLKRLARKWHRPLGLLWWTVRYEYARDARGFSSINNGHVHSTTAAMTTADWKYMHATISWNLTETVGYSDEDLERMVVHELCHVLVNEMREDFGGEMAHDTVVHEERVVSTLAQAFLWTREAGREDKAA